MGEEDLSYEIAAAAHTRLLEHALEVLLPLKERQTGYRQSGPSSCRAGPDELRPARDRSDGRPQ